MAKRVDSFKKQRVEGPRRYPWGQWADGDIWEIQQGVDYDVPTESMRVNIHERAKGIGRVARTEKVSIGTSEGLRFQFQQAPRESPFVTASGPGPRKKPRGKGR